MKSTFLKTTLSTLAIVLLAATASANITVYNNFGEEHGGWDYNYGLGWTIAGENVAAQYGVEQAFLFEPSASGTMTDIWAPMWYVPIDSGYDEVTFRLVANTNGAFPTEADIMEEWVVTDFESWTAWSDPHHFTGDGTSYLEAGTSYWLWAVGGETTWCGWCMNNDPALTLPHTLRREDQEWLSVSLSTAPAFRVDVLPEPASLSLLSLGLLALLRRR